MEAKAVSELLSDGYSSQYRLPIAALDFAAQSNLKETVAQLLADGTGVNVERRFHSNVLGTAALEGSVQVVELLLEKGGMVVLCRQLHMETMRRLCKCFFTTELSSMLKKRNYGKVLQATSYGGNEEDDDMPVLFSDSVDMSVQ